MRNREMASASDRNDPPRMVPTLLSVAVVLSVRTRMPQYIACHPTGNVLHSAGNDLTQRSCPPGSLLSSSYAPTVRSCLCSLPRCHYLR